MGFYEQIAPYYDFIFPAGEEQLEMIRSTAGKPPKKLLDIACGAGIYSLELAAAGYDVWATDLDPEMIRQTQERAVFAGVAVKALQLDMLALEQLEESEFDCVFCIGNSIVHLGSKESILEALVKMKGRLGSGGSLLLQIINFDRILAKGITSLPTLKNPEVGLEFVRNYSYDKKTGLISFDTELRLIRNGGEQKYENSIMLFPLLSPDFRAILERAGFANIAFYGGFAREAYIPEESFLLVVRASV